MKIMNYIVVILFLLGSSCHHLDRTLNKLDLPIPPSPPPFFKPSSQPPNFTPNLNELRNIQINSVPHPFNLNGHYPFVVWLDGKRLPLKSGEIKHLANALNIHFKQPKNTAQIHNGEGWLYPFPIKENNGRKDLNNREYGQKETSSQ